MLNICLVDGNYNFKWNLSVQFMDGPTSYMQLLVVTSENMVTEPQEFGFTQEQQSSTSVLLLVEMQTIVTTVMLCPFIDQAPLLSNKFSGDERTVAGATDTATILKSSSMESKRSVLSTANQQSFITWNTTQAILGTTLLLPLSAILNSKPMDTDIRL